MVTIKRRIIISLFALCLFFLFSITAFAADPVIPKTSFDYKGTDAVASAKTTYRTDTAFFKDEAELLTEDQQVAVWKKLQETAKGTNIKIAVFLGGNYRTDDETENFTYDCAAAVFGVNSDSMFIYLDFEGYSPSYDTVRVLNKAENYFNETARNKILQSMYQYLPSSGKPIYSDKVEQALLQGFSEITAQYSGRVDQPSSASGYYDPQQPRQDQAPRRSQNSDPDTIWGMPTFVFYIVGAIVVIVILLIFSAIARAIGRLCSCGGCGGFGGGGYGGYSGGSSYYRSGGYYGGYSGRRHHHRPPPPPPHRAPPRPSRGPSGPSGGGSSRPSGPSSSSSGHHR